MCMISNSDIIKKILEEDATILDLLKDIERFENVNNPLNYITSLSATVNVCNYHLSAIYDNNGYTLIH